jgi:hypothetical protein
MVVGVEHDDTHAQRVEALAAETLHGVLAVLRPVVRVDGGSPLVRPGAGVVRLLRRPAGAGEQQPATTPTASATRARRMPYTGPRSDRRVIVYLDRTANRTYRARVE